MTPIVIQSIFFILLLVSIYFISRLATNEIFHFLRIFIKEERVVFSIVSLFFLPGTILHELAHFFGAMILMLHVRDIIIFPQFEGNYIKLGSVLYEKKDVFRSILVGIAPVFAGLVFFWMIANFKLFPNSNSVMNILFLYGIFAVSSTMFSSKKDLQDLIFIIPIGIGISAIVYIFNIRLDFILGNKFFVEGITGFMRTVNQYLFLSLVVNGAFTFVLKSIQFLIRGKV